MIKNYECFSKSKGCFVKKLQAAFNGFNKCYDKYVVFISGKSGKGLILGLKIWNVTKYSKDSQSFHKIDG